MIFVPLPACCLRLLDLIKSSNTTCCYTGSMVRFYVQEVQRDTSLHVPSSQGSNGQNETPFKGTQHQHSAATARSSRGHDHTRVPSILLAFWNWCWSRSVCFFGVEKRQPVKATNQSLNVHVEREHCLFFVYSDLSEGWETPRLYNIMTVETFCFVCVLVLNKFYAMLSPFLFSGVHLANDPDRWVKQEIWLDKNHWKHFKRTPSWRYGCFRK